MGKKKRMCYKCGALASSKEHVPPRCLFPEEKDIRTSLFRHNLITVPSCDEHNSHKSKDDEFLLACITGIVGNNVLGFFHNMTKVKRVLEQKGAGFLRMLEDQKQISTIKDRPGDILPVMLNRKDMERLHDCFEHIAYGLYFHKFKIVFDGECRIVMDFLTFENETEEKFKLLVRKRFEYEPILPVGEGKNPEVFRYDFMKPDKDGLIAMRMIFYEGATVFVTFMPKGKAPFHLTSALIEAGITTFIDFPDGTSFAFNERKGEDRV